MEALLPCFALTQPGIGPIRRYERFTGVREPNCWSEILAQDSAAYIRRPFRCTQATQWRPVRWNPKLLSIQSTPSRSASGRHWNPDFQRESIRSIESRHAQSRRVCDSTASTQGSERSQLHDPTYAATGDRRCDRRVPARSRLPGQIAAWITSIPQSIE